MSTNQNVIWIASYPKSGSTWFRLILNSFLEPDKEVINFNLAGSESLIMAGNRNIFDTVSGTNSSDLTRKEINHLRPQVYRTISRNSDQTLYVKVHDIWQKNESGDDLFPGDITKGVVLIVRNPFDLAVSFANHSGISIKESIRLINNVDFCLESNPFKLPAQLSQKISSWSIHYKSWADDSGLKIHIIRYEDLLSHPIKSFSKALNFLNINHNSSQLATAIEKCSFHNLQRMEKEIGFNEKPIKSDLFFKTGQAYYWRNYLDKDDEISLLTANYEILERCNYLEALHLK